MAQKESHNKKENNRIKDCIMIITSIWESKLMLKLFMIQSVFSSMIEWGEGYQEKVRKLSEE